MVLTAELFEVPLSMEFSPQALHGLSHREIGDHTDAMSLLVEVAEPMIDRIRGITDEYLLMTGRDEFVMKAGEHKLLYAPIDERGWPIDVRVGRHSSTFQKMLEFSLSHPTVLSSFQGAGYTEVIENTLGAYFVNPEEFQSIKCFTTNKGDEIKEVREKELVYLFLRKQIQQDSNKSGMKLLKRR